MARAGPARHAKPAQVVRVQFDVFSYTGLYLHAQHPAQEMSSTPEPLLSPPPSRYPTPQAQISLAFSEPLMSGAILHRPLAGWDAPRG